MPKPWEAIGADDSDDWDPDDYCVKVGQWIKGGCQEEICEDIGSCPYIKQQFSNKVLDKE